MPHRTDPLARAEQTAHQWLVAVAKALGTDDHRYTYRVLRAWLHAVRDRLTVESAAHFGAQLPELLRGTYFEGWMPSHVPVRTDVAVFGARLASEAGIGVYEVRRTCNAVASAMRELFSSGQLDHALALMPKAVRSEFFERDLTSTEPEGNGKPRNGELRALREDIDLLADAVSTLAHGLEEHPDDEPHNKRGIETARKVHDIMLAREASRHSQRAD